MSKKDKEKELDRLIDEICEGEGDEYKSMMKDIVKGVEKYEKHSKEWKKKKSKERWEQTKDVERQKIDDDERKLMNDLLKVTSQFFDESVSHVGMKQEIEKRKK